MLRRSTALTTIAFVLLVGGLVAAQEPTKREAQPPVTDSATVGKLPGEATKTATKNDVAPPITTRKGAYTCDIAIDNRTPWTIHRIYIDSEYWGGMGRYGDVIMRDVDTGRTKVYAEADFNDGSTKHWGPRWFDCGSYSTYTWTLRQ